MTDERKPESPNPKIDKAIKALMSKIETSEEPLDMKVKVLNMAINWEKVKHSIKDSEEYDPSSI